MLHIQRFLSDFKNTKFIKSVMENYDEWFIIIYEFKAFHLGFGEYIAGLNSW